MRKGRRKYFVTGMALCLALVSSPIVSNASEHQPGEEFTESLMPEEDEEVFMEGGMSGIDWKMENGVFIIFGEGPIDWANCAWRDEKMSRAEKVRFQDCKIWGRMGGFFSGYENIKSIDLSGLDTSQVTDMRGLFSDCSGLISLDVSGFDTSQVTNMECMFENCSGLTDLDVSGFNTSKVTAMWNMFSGCSGLTSLDVSGFDTSQVVYMNGMFSGCFELASLDVSSFDTSRVTDMEGMFTGCYNLTSLDVSDFDTSLVTNMRAMFSGCSGLTSLDVSGFDTSRVTDIGWMFQYCSGLKSLDVSGFDTSQANYMGWMFGGCSGLTSLDVSGFDTSRVTSGMEGMFSSCSGLTSLDVSGFDTSRVTDMGNMFSECSGLTKLDVSGFNTSRVTGMGSMFYDCSGLKELDVSGFDTSQVTYTEGMFRDCSGLRALDISGFDTSCVTNMGGMFAGCSGLTKLDVSSFDTSQVTGMWGLFEGCSGITSLDVSSFDTSRVTNMGMMFEGCSSLTSLDLSNFDTSHVVEDDIYVYHSYSGMSDMFSGCNKLNTIKAFKKAPVYVTCELPGSYMDENGNKTKQITAGFEGKTLKKTEEETPKPDSAEKQVRDFVSRMYTVALGRTAEEGGLNDWTSRLLNHEIDGAGIANGFIMSDEFTNKKVSNEEYVDILYHTFFDRNADQGGRATWLERLTNGNSRAFVLAGFVNSVEFDNLCSRYGIIRGEMQVNENPASPGVRNFVERCYIKVLGREGEKAGVDDWTGRILRGEQTPESVAKLFFFSDEYINKNIGNEVFVETLYQTFMDRASDPAGKADWVGRLANGTSREEVLEGFSRSDEFAKIMKSFGL